MSHYFHSPAVVKTKLADLRPTQFTVGYAEVAMKAADWAKLSKKERKIELHSRVFPAVLGLKSNYYIVDHHHLGIALGEEGIEEVWVAQLDDLSWLDPLVFWRTMEFRSWTHPYDHRGERRDYEEMPRNLKDLRDDPYRSLAGMVRVAGGYAKTATPFAEFLWADYFRPQISARMIAKEAARATKLGVKLARAEVARYLPGWSGST